MEPQNQIIRAVLDLSPEISAAYSQAATLAGKAREKARDAVYRAYQCGQLLHRQALPPELLDQLLPPELDGVLAPLP